MNNITTYNFSDHFIERFADDLVNHYLAKHGDFSRLMLVFGGKRPALFLKRELARRIKGAFIPPKMITMDEFISGVFHQGVSARSLNDLEAAFELYAIAQKEAPEILKGRESFARFLPWAREILGFIDQVDLENVSDEELLNVQKQAAIGYDVPDAINQLLTQIVQLRRSFHQFLSDNHLSRRGWVYHQASRGISNASFPEADEIWFCNFFYWHKTEEMIVQHMFDSGRVKLFFQGDERRWPVLKNQAKHLGVSILEGDKVIEPDFNLKFYRASDGHGEASVVKSILENMSVSDRAQTVIVVPESRHLIPLLSEISSVEDDFNVSMGYPLKRSSLYALLTLIMEAQLSRKNDARQSYRHPDAALAEEGSQKEILRDTQNDGFYKKNSTYYARDYLKVLQHPFIKNLSLSHDPSAARILTHKIEEVLTGKIRSPLSGSLFVSLKDMESSEELYTSCLEMFKRLSLDISREDLKMLLSFMHQTFFMIWESVNNFKQCGHALESLIDVLIERSFMKDYPLNMPIARRVLELAAEWTTGRFSRETFLQEDVFHILEETIGNEMTAFTGTPLKGLQILGLLETRSLNFDHVIMVDVNEGCLPRLRVTDPLIPREVCQWLGINRLEIEEEIQRYQFLRLLSSAQSIHLIYQENKETERSRFVEQLIWEKQKAGRRIDNVDIVQAGFVSQVRNEIKTVKKTPEMIVYLKQMTFSASSVNMYLRNPMDFYRQYILGIREEDDQLEEPGAKEVGIFVHALLQEAFEPFIGRKPEIDAAFRKRFDELFESRFKDMFEKSMKSDAFLVKTVLRERLKRFLDHESEHESRRVKEVMSLEKKFTQTISLSCGDVKFAYVVDRIDRMDDGTVMIIDYKTGGVSLMLTAIDRWQEHEWSREYLAESVKSFQIPLYYHYLREVFPDGRVNAALYHLKTLSFEKFLTDKTTADPADMDQVFMKALDFIVSEILNPDVNFEDHASL